MQILTQYSQKISLLVILSSLDRTLSLLTAIPLLFTTINLLIHHWIFIAALSLSLLIKPMSQSNEMGPFGGNKKHSATFADQNEWTVSSSTAVVLVTIETWKVAINSQPRCWGPACLEAWWMTPGSRHYYYCTTVEAETHTQEDIQQRYRHR